MGKAFLYGSGGGGGGGLNFEIVGGTSQPSGRENTIWVNTDVKIPAYAFSTTEPGNHVPGMVWITIAAESPAGFNALKKGNTIMVYPIAAKQYVGGEWADVTAKSYQNGAWVDWWNGELYEPGNTYEMYTGGWQQGEFIAGSTVTITDTGIMLETGSGTRTHVETAKKVEFGDYKTLKAIVEVINSPTVSNVVRLGYSSTPKTNLADATTKSELKPGKNAAGEFTITLALDGAPSSAYVVIGAGIASTTFKVKKVQMIK